MSKPSSTNSPKLLLRLENTKLTNDNTELSFSITYGYQSHESEMPGYITVVIATGIHLFPFRTEKLSPLAPMVLLYQVGE